MNLFSSANHFFRKSRHFAHAVTNLIRTKILANPLFFKLARLLGALLTLASIALIFKRGFSEVGWDRWLAMGNALLLSTFLYGVSFNLQAWMWGLLMNRFAGIRFGWRDAEVYALSNLLRNTPGVVWYLLERVESYKKDGIQGQKTFMASTAEWVGLVLAAPIAYLIGILLDTQILTSASAIGIIFGALVLLWLLSNPALHTFFAQKPDISKRLAKFNVLPFIVSIYVLCYLLGAGLTHITTLAIEPNTSLTFPLTIKLYALLTGFIFVSTVIIPLSFGMREISLTYLLSPYVSLESAITIAAMLRLVYLGSDLIFGLLLWQISTYVKKWAKKAN